MENKKLRRYLLELEGALAGIDENYKSLQIFQTELEEESYVGTEPDPTTAKVLLENMPSFLALLGTILRDLGRNVEQSTACVHMAMEVEHDG